MVGLLINLFFWHEEEVEEAGTACSAWLPLPEYVRSQLPRPPATRRTGGERRISVSKVRVGLENLP